MRVSLATRHPHDRPPAFDASTTERAGWPCSISGRRCPQEVRTPDEGESMNRHSPRISWRTQCTGRSAMDGATSVERARAENFAMAFALCFVRPGVAVARGRVGPSRTPLDGV